MLSVIDQHPKQRSAKRFGLLLSVALVIGAAVAFGTVQLIRPSVKPTTTTSTGQQGANGPPGPTVARPLAAPAKQVSMAQATATFGSALPVPSTPVVQPSDAGPVWEISAPGGTWVAITFPSKGVFIQYGRPAPPDTAKHYKDMSTALPGSDFVQLNGTTPALYLDGNDGSGTNAIIFATNSAEIRVFGNNDEATLEAMAQSILSRG